MRIVIFGNAGSGKTTMARELTRSEGIPCLSLDRITWDKSVQRHPFEQSLCQLRDFTASRSAWIVEGCYGSLIEAALPFCTELRFLNPGVEVCVQRCLDRAWEAEKFSSPEEQRAMLESLIGWIREYEIRDDEFGLRFHRRLFEGFDGPKKEYTS
jgi:adenylate kinase family enzyme